MKTFSHRSSGGPRSTVGALPGSGVGRGQQGRFRTPVRHPRSSSAAPRHRRGVATSNDSPIRHDRQRLAYDLMPYVFVTDIGPSCCMGYRCMHACVGLIGACMHTLVSSAHACMHWSHRRMHGSSAHADALSPRPSPPLMSERDASGKGYISRCRPGPSGH